MSTTIVPFGPQHPVLPEPISLKLVMQDDIVVEALPSIGYVHRGLERLAELKDFNQSVYIVERVCGICSYMHSMAYVRGIEEMLSVQIPERTEFLRVIWAEVARIQSHLLWLGLLADAFGFESLFMECWKKREKILDIMEMTTGNRIIISVNKVGGVTKDLAEEHFSFIISVVNELEVFLKRVEKVFFNDFTVKQRLVGVGIFTMEDAIEISAVGPVARASGVSIDVRSTGYSAYKYLDFEPVVDYNCDSYGRCIVRLKEIYQSINLIRQGIAKVPKGDIAISVKGMPNGEVISRLEQPRGEAIYYIKGNGTKNLTRLKIRTPTFANIPPLLRMVPGSKLADIPILILTIDPCISCTER